MKYLIFSLLLMIIQGCSNAPTPQEEKEMHAKSTIAQNKYEATQAQAEYAALQQKRRAEGI